MNNPRKHHFVPQFLLRGFEEDGKCYVFDKVKGEIRKSNLKDICCQRDLYTLIDNNEKMFEIERFFSDVEGEFCVFLEYFIRNKELSNNEKIKHIDEYFKIISVFLNVSYWRLPSKIEDSKSLQKKARIIYDNSMDEFKGLFGMERRYLKFLEKNLNHDNNVKIFKNILLPLFCTKINEDIKECKFIYSEKELVMTDNPIVADFDIKKGLCGDIYIPLSDHYCITNRINKIDEFQRKAIFQAKRFIVSKNRELLYGLLELFNDSSK